MKHHKRNAWITLTDEPKARTIPAQLLRPTGVTCNMAGKFLHRVTRHRFHAAAIWAMVPVAMSSGRTVSGCLSPTGNFEPGCDCQAMQAARASGQAKANRLASATVLAVRGRLLLLRWIYRKRLKTERR